MSIKEHWDSFHKEVIHKGAGPVQVQEMQRAFYGGAAVMFHETVLCTADNFSQADGVKVIESLHKELKVFGEKFTKASL